MRLIELYAEEFGLFRDRRFVFDAGLTLVEGANESGKSTLQAFFFFLFYGFPRKGGAEGEERDKRLSRDGHRAAGTARFSLRGREYILRRDYLLRTLSGRDAPLEKCTVTTDTGVEIDLGGKTPGEYFFGISRELYQASACVRQSEIESVAKADTGDAVSELLFFDGGGARLETAQKLLDAARRDLQHTRGRGGRIAALEEEIAALDEALQAAREHTEALRQLRNKKANFTMQLQDKKREIAEVKRAARAAALDAELARFDAWHAAKAEEARLLSLWQAAAENETKETLPTSEAITAARDSLRQYTLAAETYRLARTEDARAANELARYPIDDIARAVEVRGGEEGVQACAARYASQKRATLIGGVLLLLFAAALATGALLLQEYWPVLTLVGGIALALAVTLLLIRGKIITRERGFYSALGVSSPLMLRTFLTQHRRDAVAREAAAAARETAAKRLADAAVRVRETLTALRTALLAVGVGDSISSPVAVQRCLDELAARLAAGESRHVEERMRYERARGITRALGAELEPERESGLRAERATLPQDVTITDEKDVERRLQFLHETQNGIAQKLLEAEREEAALAAVAHDPAALLAARETCGAELATAKHRLLAIQMAQSALGEADADLRFGVLPRLMETASEMLAKFTDGRYQKLYLSDRFAISLETKEGILPLSHFSAGCRDAVGLALRLALVFLIAKEPLPLLLDEATARLDDARTGELLRFIKELCRAGTQAILFTCHTREAAFLKEDFTYITL